METSTVKGYKNDKGKPLLALIEADFLFELGRVMTRGAEIYGLDNWKNNLERVRIMSAMLRHAFAYARGERFDPDTGYSHLAHMTANAMFLDYFDRRDNITDTRPVPNFTTKDDKLAKSENDKFGVSPAVSKENP